MALIPVFQFGVFSESDLSFYPGSNLDFTGPVHTNGDLYPFAGSGANLTFHCKLSAYGNVVRTQLPNGLAASGNYNGTVYIPSADGDCTQRRDARWRVIAPPWHSVTSQLRGRQRDRCGVHYGADGGELIQRFHRHLDSFFNPART